jgi:tetratricopeptide (TPR) repeat protein
LHPSIYFRFLAVCMALALSPVGGFAQNADDSIAEARELTNAGDFEGALLKLDALLATQSDHVGARLYKGVVLTRAGRVNEAVELFKNLARDHPDLAEPHNNLAVLYARQSRYEKARDALIRATELQPRYDTAHENLGDIYAKLAAVSYNRAYQLNNANTRARDKSTQVALVFESQGSAGKASASGPPPAMKAAQSTPPAVVPRVETPEPGTPPVVESRVPDQMASPAAAAPAAGPGRCYRAGNFPDTDTSKRVARWMKDRGAEVVTLEQRDGEVQNYRVYVPALENWESVQSTLTTMRKKGIKDIMGIPSGELQNAISVGVFSTEGAARRRAGQLKTKGYLTQIAPRMRKRAAFRLTVSTGDGATLDPDLFALRFPDYSLQGIQCPRSTQAPAATQ